MQKMQGAIGANLVIFLVHHTQVVFGWLEVMQSSNTSFVQKIYRFNNGITQITVRGYVNSKWYPWHTINTSVIS